MRPLDEIRKDIDRIDGQIRELLMQRLDLSEQVAAAKIDDKNYVIYRADREKAMLARLGQGIPEDRLADYLAVVRKVTETSRMYQYGLLFDNVPELSQKLLEDVQLPENAGAVRLRLTRDNVPNAMSAILSMIGDAGYDMDRMKLLSYSGDRSQVSFELTILGDLHEKRMQQLMLAISMESTDFQLLEVLPA